jgi:large subunit ribosomal protein L7A
MSTEGPQQPGLVAGLTQSKKLIKIGMASSAYLAKDADAKIINLISELCYSYSVPCEKTKTKKELGLMCGIDVDCAVCVTLK